MVIAKYVIIRFSIHGQVDIPSPQARCMHTTAAVSPRSGLTEVILFGGCPEWPRNYRSDSDFQLIDNTTVLQIGTSTFCLVWSNSD